MRTINDIKATYDLIEENGKIVMSKMAFNVLKTMLTDYSNLQYTDCVSYVEVINTLGDVDIIEEDLKYFARKLDRR